MATVHKGYRLDVELVGRLDAWAEAHGMTQAEAVRTLLAAGLEDAGEGQEEEGVRSTHTQGQGQGQGSDGATLPNWQGKGATTADADARAMLGEHIRDLQAAISTLTAQVAEKDAQIRRLSDIADHAQALQAAQAQTQLLEAAGAVDVQQGVQQGVEREGTQRQGWRARLARWIAGGKE
ncbi:hypothetical protein ACTND8_09985 [Atopobiaceae bacterium HCP3S3_F7]